MLRNHHGDVHQQPPDNSDNQKERLRTYRLNSYLGDPNSYGSRLTTLSDRLVSTSHDTISEDAKSKMAVKITDIMKPFNKDNNKEG